MQQSPRDYENLPMKFGNSKVTNKQANSTYTIFGEEITPVEQYKYK